MLYPETPGEQLSIDETSLSHGELYTILANKAAKGKKGAIVAGTKADTVISVLKRISERARKKVTEVTLDIAGNMELICKRCFPQATRMTDRFHIQKLATQALQNMRVKYRWEALDAENEANSKKQTSHHQTILNYFDNTSTNASAESFNAKIKAFRNLFGGGKI